jgi:hypothetical protein
MKSFGIKNRAHKNFGGIKSYNFFMKSFGINNCALLNPMKLLGCIGTYWIQSLKIDEPLNSVVFALVSRN